MGRGKPHGVTMATKAKRAKRKGVKSGGEAPCTKCRKITQTPKRDRNGRFKAKK